MTHDLLESISQRISGTEDAENCRIYEVANELYRRCRLYESELRKGEKYVRASDIERIITEEYANEFGLWIPISQIFELGTPGPSGNENDTYVKDNLIFKVNNLLNSNGSVLQLFCKMLLHNMLFVETAYKFYGFTGFPGSSIMAVFTQYLIKDATPATMVEIATYMAALGFDSTPIKGRFTNQEFEVWDLLPRNVLKDSEGDIFVIDAEIKLCQNKP